MVLKQGPNVTEMKIAREETYLDQLPTNHGVPMNFGGNPYSEKGRQYLRPQPSLVRGSHNTPHLVLQLLSLLSTFQLDQPHLKSICLVFQE